MMSKKEKRSKSKLLDVEIKHKESNNVTLIEDYVRESCLVVNLNHKYTNKPKPFMRPRLKQVAQFVLMGLR
jgi:hypothetical protein